MCFECLQRQIQSDFLEKLIFCYGLSDSPLPFALKFKWRRIPQFLLTYMPLHKDSCLANYIDQHCLEDLEARMNSGSGNAVRVALDQLKLRSVLYFSYKTSSLETKSSECEEFLAGSLEDHTLNSIALMIEGKRSGRESVNFLSLVGIPSFGEEQLPGCIRHPNISPILGMSDWYTRYLLFQILSGLAYMHGLGVSHGNVCPSSISLFLLSSASISKIEGSPDSGVSCCFDGCPLPGLYADLNLYQSTDCNFGYLLILNKLAGRRWGANTFYFVMPWVIYFSVKPDENNDTGWRDLTKSKLGLAKGDEQLDFTYLTSEIPNHISDECLPELAVCSYKARSLPLTVLRMAVRSIYEPNEYPCTMQRLYQWTPDECIPEFYCEPQIFYSIHSGMSDLAVPSWAGTPEEFVSHQLHHWIDITFGYKLCGDAAVAARNVIFPSSTPTKPKSVGRHQRFTKPHPPWRRAALGISDKISEAEMIQVPTTAPHLDPIYNLHPDAHEEVDSPGKDLSSKTLENITSRKTVSSVNTVMPSVIDVSYLLKYSEVGDNVSAGYQALLLLKQKCYHSHFYSEDVANDIFAVGCIFAELHLRIPFFDPTSLAVYLESGVLPTLVQELPPDTQVVVESCIQKDWRRRLTAKCLLDSPYFLATIKSSYLFLAPLQLIAKDESRLRYAAAFAQQGALKAMGTFAAEMCAPNCLRLFLRCMNPEAVKKLVVPAIQKILQVYLLQGSFVLDIWNKIGKQAYVETIHPFVVLNLHSTPCKNSATAACVLLIGSSEERCSQLLCPPYSLYSLIFGNTYTFCEFTILPLLHCVGKGLSDDGIDVLVRTGSLVGEDFIVKQILPLLGIVILSCIDNSFANKHETAQSWSALALIDTLMTLDGLTASLTREVKELVEDSKFLYLQVLMQTNLGVQVVEGAARSLLALCPQIGSDLTALHVLPKLRQLFDEFSFSQEKAGHSSIRGGSIRGPNTKGEDENKITSRLDLWESAGESSRSVPSSIHARKPTCGEILTSECTPDKMLLSGKRGAKPPAINRHPSSQHQDSADRNARGSDFSKTEPWYWFPSPAANWSGPDFIGRPGGAKDELPWKTKASVLHSVRAHQGVLRFIAVCQDECYLFTAGVAPGFKGTVQSRSCLELILYLVIISMRRFIDVRQGQKLHLWRSEATESIFPSLISSICSRSSTKQQYGNDQYPSWVSVGQSSGQCRSYHMRSGKIISSWQAHDGFVTKVATPEEHLLVSSSLDSSLRIWDLRRNWKSKPLASRGHTDGVSDFSIWGQNVISISRSKIGLSSLASSSDELFVVGTEDGHLKICC
ncbi:unnamed protein product [Withania somnifera]